MIVETNKPILNNLNKDISNYELSSNSLLELFTLEKKKLCDVNLKYQIISTIKMDSQTKQDVYTAILSDGNYKYKNFVIKKNQNECEFNPFQIINIKQLYSTNLKTEKNSVFVISNYIFLSKYDKLINKPETLSDSLINSISYSKNDHKTSNTNNEDDKINKDVDNKNIHNIPAIDKDTEVKRTQFMSNSYNNNNHSNNNRLNNNNKKDMEYYNNIYDLIPISKISLYTKDPTIYVRVVSKGQLKTFNSSRGFGCLFTFNVIDKEGTEMQISCFNKAADKFHKIIENKMICIIKGGYVKVNDKKFNNTNCQYKITLEEKSEIITDIIDNNEIKLFTMDITKLKDMIELKVGSFVDVMGVVVELDNVIYKSTKGGDVKMRRIFIVDQSLYKIELSLWKNYSDLDLKINDVLMCKCLKVGDFNGRNLATYNDSQIVLNPSDCKEAEELNNFIKQYKGEYTTLNANGTKTKVISQNLQIKFMTEALESLNKFYNSSVAGDEIPVMLKVTIYNFNNSDRYVYAGCPDSNCKKKLTEAVQNRGYFCSLCNLIYESPCYYYNVSVIIKDSSCEFWVDLFGGIGEKLIGISGNEYHKLYAEKNEYELNKIAQKIEFTTFIVQVKPKMGNFNGVWKKKLQILSIEALNINKDFERIYNNFIN